MLVKMTEFRGKSRDVPYSKWAVVSDSHVPPHRRSEKLEGASKK